LFTQDFKKFKYAMMAIGVAALVFLGAHLGLSGLARWAESSSISFPYLAGEDPIRYLLPTMMKAPERSGMLLIGASETGENMLYEEFQKAFPEHHIMPGGISTGTFDDILLALNYREKVFGTDTLPGTIVVGISYRIVANIPRRFGEKKAAYSYSPLLNSINNYSSEYKVVDMKNGSRLEKKNYIESIIAEAHFLLKKQQPRYRAAMAALVDLSLENTGYTKASIEKLPFLENLWNPLNRHDVRILGRFADQYGLLSTLRLWLSSYKSPYQTQYMPPQQPEEIAKQLKTAKFWQDLYQLDLTNEAGMMEHQMEELLTFAQSKDIELYIVNMPENSISLDLYDPDNYQFYLQVVKNSLNKTPFLDLKDLLKQDKFLDETHATLQGAQLVTDQVISFIKKNNMNN